MKHTKIIAALKRYGEEKFEKDSEEILSYHPKARIVLGLYGDHLLVNMDFHILPEKNIHEQRLDMKEIKV